MARIKREYSRAFTPQRGNGRSYTIKKIPAGLWDQVQDKARREGVSLRAHVLRFLSEWAQAPDAGPKGEAEAAAE